MRQILILLGLVLSACVSVSEGDISPAIDPSPPWSRIVDLSHPFDSSTVFWPTEEGFVLERGFAGETEQGYWYEANRFRSAEHGGTHIDAPVHFAEGRHTVDQIPIERLVGEGVVIDVAEQCSDDPDYGISVADIQGWEREHGALPGGAIVLFRTGWSSRWPDRLRYLGTARRGAEAVAELHFPGLSPEAARWLLANRDIGAVGLDTASIDPGQSKLFESHRILFEQNVPAFENLAGLDALPARAFTVIALPMKIKGGSGGPLRAIALLD